MSNPNKDGGNPLDFGLENLDVQETLSKTTDFFQANKSKIVLSGIILLALAGSIYGIFGVFLPNRQEEAQNMMYMAERYFENDSLSLAINGDGNFPGFLEIESDYSWTDAGRLARYYLGVSYLRQGRIRRGHSLAREVFFRRRVAGKCRKGSYSGCLFRERR